MSAGEGEVPSSWAWPQRRPLLSLVILMVATRALVLVVATLADMFGPPGGPVPWSSGAPGVRALARWDSGYYIGIADEGRDAQLARWAFSPGYPMGMRALAAVLPGHDVALAGALLSFAASLGVVVALYALTSRWFGKEHAWRAGALLASLPSSFYLSAVYPEAVFLLVLCIFLLALASERWWTAGALASAAGVLRPQGVLVVGILALGLVVAHLRGRPVRGWHALALPLAVALPLLDMLVAYRASGDPFLSAHVREALWPVSWRAPWEWITLSLYPTQRIAVLVMMPLCLASVGWAARDAWRRRLDAPLEAYAWCGGIVLISLCYAELAPTLRYALPVLTVPWMLAAVVRTPVAFSRLLGGALVLQLLVAVLFALWYPLY